MEAFNFLRNDLNERESSPEAQTLAMLKKKIQDQRNTFLYAKDLRQISPGNIDVCEEELRQIVGEIQRLRSTTYMDDLLYSVDGVQSNINTAIDRLYIVSDILTKHIAKGSKNIKEREMLYQKFRECSKYLTEALKYFIMGVIYFFAKPP